MLDATLGSAAGVFGAGELANLFTEVVEGRPCSCGSLLQSCPVWQHVLVPALGDPAELDQLSRAVESAPRPSATLAGSHGAVWRAVFDRLATVQQASWVVDSSKSTRATAHRPLRLAGAGLEVHVIHLLRDPRAVMISLTRGTNRQLMGIRPSTRHRGAGMLRAVRGAAAWARADAAARRLSKHPEIASYRTLRFEDLCADPGAVLSSLGEGLGVELGNIDLQAVTPGHGIAGNRARTTTPVLRPALAAGPGQFPAVWSILFRRPLRRYGYP